MTMKSKIKSVCLLLGVSLFVGSCNQSRDSKTTVIQEIWVDINSPELQKEVHAFDKFDFLQLEFTDGSALRSIDKVLPYKDKLYILSAQDPKVFIFSSTGKYLTSINRGQGPGEILFANDIDTYKDTLYVLDLYRTIKKYNLEGEYIGVKHKLERPLFSIKSTGQGFLLFDPNIDKQSDYNLHYISQDTVANYLKKKDFLKEANFLYRDFYRKGYISWPLSDTIYVVKENVPYAEYVIKFKGNSFYNQDLEKPVTPTEFCEMNQDKTCMRWIKDVMPYDGGLYFAFNYDHTYFVRYNHDEVKIFPKFIDGLPEMKQAAVGYCDTKLIYILSAENILQYKMDNPNVKNNDRVRLLYESVKTEEDNPVLIYVDVCDLK